MVLVVTWGRACLATLTLGTGRGIAVMSRAVLLRSAETQTPGWDGIRHPGDLLGVGAGEGRGSHDGLVLE